MKHYKVMLAVFCALFAISCDQADEVTSSKYDAPSENMANINNKKIVVLKHGADKAKFKDFAKLNGLAINADLDIINGFAVTLASGASSKAFEAIIKHMDVEFVEDDVEGSTMTQTTPWGIDRVDFDLTWGQFFSTSSSSGVKVGIIDTGIDRDHPDLASNLAGGVEFVSGVSTYEDDNGHGTHVAGTIAALNNTSGVVGGAPTARIYAVKALDRYGKCSSSQVISALQWCVNNGMNVINMSIGFSSYSSSMSSAIKAAYANGITLVAAAGNTSGSVMYPAAYPEVIAVSSVDKYNKLSSFSARGTQVDIAAPGSSIRSTYKGNTYATMSGTSMACPHVVAAVALLKAKYPDATPAQILNHLKNTAENIGLPANYQGAGLLDAENAMNTNM